MATIVLNYDPNRYWEEFLTKNHLRHETFANDSKRFILYYYDEFHLLKIGFEFGLFYQLKTLQNEPNVQ